MQFKKQWENIGQQSSEEFRYMFLWKLWVQQLLDQLSNAFVMDVRLPIILKKYNNAI